MANTHRKRCLLPVVPRRDHSKSQWNTTSHPPDGHHLKIKNTCPQGWGKMGTLIHCWWECLLNKLLWEKFNLNTIVTQPSNFTPGYITPSPPKLKTKVQTKMCTWMYIAALFITVNIWDNSNSHRVING